METHFSNDFCGEPAHCYIQQPIQVASLLGNLLGMLYTALNNLFDQEMEVHRHIMKDVREPSPFLFN